MHQMKEKTQKKKENEKQLSSILDFKIQGNGHKDTHQN